jgi:flagellar hook assembly protein FlgD
VGSVTLPYDLSADGVVTMRLYDSRGRRIRTLVAGATRPHGGRTESWDGRDDDGYDAPAGIYIVRLEVAGRHLERRFPLIR